MNERYFNLFPKGVSVEDKEMSDICFDELMCSKTINRLKEIVDKIDSIDEEDFYSDNYGYEWEISDLFHRLNRVAYELFSKKEYSSIVDIGRRVLEIYGIEGTELVSIESPSSAVSVAESVNMAAKEISQSFYSLKPILIVSAWKLGADFGFGDDSAYYLGTTSVGVASFHDPGDEIGNIILNLLSESIPIWDHAWSGVIRQDDAFNIMYDLEHGGDLVEQYRDATSTDDMKRIRRTYMDARYSVARAKIADFLNTAL